MFYKAGVLKNFANFTRKNTRPVTMLKNRLQLWCFSCEF